MNCYHFMRNDEKVITMIKLDKVKWGFIGCGEVTEKKSGPAFAMIEGSEVVAVMSRDKEKAQSYAKRHNIPRWYSDPQQLIGDEDVNAIYIATPPPPMPPLPSWP